MTISESTILDSLLGIESPVLVIGIHFSETVRAVGKKSTVVARYEVLPTVPMLHQLHDFDKFLWRELQTKYVYFNKRTILNNISSGNL